LVSRRAGAGACRLQRPRRRSLRLPRQMGRWSACFVGRTFRSDITPAPTNRALAPEELTCSLARPGRGVPHASSGRALINDPHALHRGRRHPPL
jgi:hypothetical protein